MARPAKVLKGFAKRHLAAAESVLVALILVQPDCAGFKAHMRAWQAEAGTSGIFFGQSAGDLVQAGVFHLQAARLAV